MIDAKQKAEIEAHYAKELSAGFEHGDGSMDFAQIVNGQWWHPKFGCDSLDAVAEEIAALKAKIERVRGILIRVPNCCVPAVVFAKGIKDALKEIEQ